MLTLSVDQALFLDIDGTLIDIAPTPDSVVVPQGLRETLAGLRAALGGALAVISGRPMTQIDQLLAQPGLPAAAEHGALTRLPDGQIERSAQRLMQYDTWLDALRTAATGWPGVLVEAKTYTLVVHYRLAPALEETILAFIRGLVGDTEADILRARMAFEIRPTGFGKGSALRRLMQVAPFAGRVPLFIGDDMTDEEAIAAAIDLGGIGLHVDRNFNGSPQAVRDWLTEAAHGLDRTHAP